MPDLGRGALPHTSAHLTQTETQRALSTARAAVVLFIKTLRVALDAVDV